MPALELADCEALQVGDLVLAIGNPFGVGQTVSSGVVSGLALLVGSGQGYFVQTNAPINLGNSDGALVNMAGALIGINTAIVTAGPMASVLPCRRTLSPPCWIRPAPGPPPSPLGRCDRARG